MRTYKKGSHSSHQQVIVYIILLYYLSFKKQQLTCLGTNVCLLYLFLLCHLSSIFLVINNSQEARSYSWESLGLQHQISQLQEINPEYSLEGLMLKLRLQYFGHLMWRTEPTHWKISWCWERLKVGGEGDNRGWDGWIASPTQWTWVWANSRRWWWTGKTGVLQSMGSQRVRHNWATEQ